MSEDSIARKDPYRNQDVMEIGEGLLKCSIPCLIVEIGSPVLMVIYTQHIWWAWGQMDLIVLSMGRGTVRKLNCFCGTGQGAQEFSPVQLNAADMLKNLLSDLYIDSANLTMDKVIGEGGFATVYK